MASHAEDNAIISGRVVSQFEQSGRLVLGIVFASDHPGYLRIRGKEAALQRTICHIGKEREKTASHPPPKAGSGRPEKQKTQRDD